MNRCLQKTALAEKRLAENKD